MDLLEHGAVAAIRDLVEESGLRKSDVCRRSGVSRALLDDYLAGRKEPSLRQLKRVADALDLRLELRIGPRVRPISDEYIAAIRLAGTLARGRNSAGDQQLRFPDRVWARFRTATAQTQPPFSGAGGVSDREPDLLERLGVIHRSLAAAGINHAVGGALALAHHVYPPRGTVDIDLNVLADADDADPLFRALPAAVEISPDATDQVRRTGQIRLWWRGELSTPVDLFFPQHPTFHQLVIERARPADFLGETIKVLTPGDLMVFKMLFDRRKDWADIEALVRAGTDTTEPARWVAAFVGPDDHRLQALAEVVAEVAGEAR